jgi:hypothetical protein
MARVYDDADSKAFAVIGQLLSEGCCCVSNESCCGVLSFRIPSSWLFLIL